MAAEGVCAGSGRYRGNAVRFPAKASGPRFPYKSFELASPVRGRVRGRSGGELVEDVGDISAPEGLEDPLDPVGVLDLIRGHVTAPLIRHCRKVMDRN